VRACVGKKPREFSSFPPPPPRDSIAELNQTDPSPGLQVRVGVTTGEALVVLGGAGRRPPI
jgi:class 3 adenylate cyclase